MVEDDIEEDVRAVLKALATRKNVIVSGPPGTGKSRVLNQVRDLFEWKTADGGTNPGSDFPLPPDRGPLPEWFPSPERTEDRKTFSTVFDQNTKYRDFMRGLVPQVNVAGQFVVTSGTLYRASVHALKPGNAALVIVDEINRGPAVATFGSALVGLEADKRLGGDGKRLSTTQEFELLADDGSGTSFALPADLYVLGAMNEADTSVEPLDVAFLRRFAPYRLSLKTDVLRKHFGLGTTPVALPQTASTSTDVYEALAQAWESANRLILLARGTAYQLGHGALMHRQASTTSGLAPALEYASEAWATLRGHLDEVFFGDTRAMVDVLHANRPGSPYALEEATFGGQSVSRIIGPIRPSTDQLYKLLVLIANG
jgi:5-methylcytosine-specific restriction protein B